MGVHNKPSPPCFHVSSCDLLAQLKAVSSCSYVTGFLFTEFRRVLYCQYHFFHGCNWKNVFTVRLLWSKTALIVDTHFFSSLQPHVFPYMEKQCYSIFIQIDHKMATFCFVVPFNSRWQLLLPSIDLQKKNKNLFFFWKLSLPFFLARGSVCVCARLGEAAESRRSGGRRWRSLDHATRVICPSFVCVNRGWRGSTTGAPREEPPTRPQPPPPPAPTPTARCSGRRVKASSSLLQRVAQNRLQRSIAHSIRIALWMKTSESLSLGDCTRFFFTASYSKWNQVLKIKKWSASLSCGSLTPCNL